MKFKRMSPILIAGALVLSATPGWSEYGKAGASSFACDTSGNTPVTVKLGGESNSASRPLIRWDEEHFPNGTAQQLCQESVSKFQSNQGKSQGLATGNVSGTPLVCFVETERKCTASDPVLFSLKPTENPEEVLYSITHVRVRGDNTTFGRRRSVWFSLFFR